MADAKHGMKNIGLLSGGSVRATNAPPQYRDRKLRPGLQRKWPPTPRTL